MALPRLRDDDPSSCRRKDPARAHSLSLSCVSRLTRIPRGRRQADNRGGRRPPEAKVKRRGRPAAPQATTCPLRRAVSQFGRSVGFRQTASRDCSRLTVPQHRFVLLECQLHTIPNGVGRCGRRRLPARVVRPASSTVWYVRTGSSTSAAPNAAKCGRCRSRTSKACSSSTPFVPFIVLWRLPRVRETPCSPECRLVDQAASEDENELGPEQDVFRRSARCSDSKHRDRRRDDQRNRDDRELLYV